MADFLAAYSIQNWLESCYQLMDQVKLPKSIRKWKREDLYRA